MPPRNVVLPPTRPPNIRILRFPESYAIIMLLRAMEGCEAAWVQSGPPLAAGGIVTVISTSYQAAPAVMTSVNNTASANPFRAVGN